MMPATPEDTMGLAAHEGMDRLFELAPGGVPILVIGDVMIDQYLIGRCERISPEAPVQIVNVTESRRILGGAGNVVANIGALNGRPSILTVTGDDAVAAEVRDLLGASWVGPSRICAETGRRTPEKTRLLAAHQQVVRFDLESCTPISAGTERQFLRFLETHSDFKALVLSDYGKGVLTPRICETSIAWAAKHGIPAVVDPKGSDYGKYAGATMITPNRKEASEAAGIPITDRESLLRAGNALRERLRVEHCLVTMGEDGMALFSADGFHPLPTQAREVFDVTGAGDTVVSTLAVACALGLPVMQACELANVAAGIKVGKLGTATVSLSELRSVATTADRALDLGDKVKSTDELVSLLDARRARGARVVFTNGCFDILHRGHVEFLAKAAGLGDILVVGLNSDASVRRLKGSGRPIHEEDDRARILAALSSVDYVTLFEDDTPLRLVARVQPDVLVKGGDYDPETIVGADLVRGRGGTVVVLPLVPSRSTSATLKRIGERAGS
jgi:D-beta-D-heptose 7-phosphate kinase/D-beta-D-heptose 1-phosphate adenosyltransferase